MRKPLSSRQEKELQWYRDNLPTHDNSDIMLLARIRQPKIFTYSKPYELHNKSAQIIAEKLSYIMMMWHYLPKRLQQGILSDTNFLRFVTEDILVPMENELKKKQRLKKKRQVDKDEIYENMDTLFQVYKTFFKLGITGLKDMMPMEFQNYLDNQIQPTLQLMDGIGQYTKQIKGFKPLLKPYSFSSGI